MEFYELIPVGTQGDKGSARGAREIWEFIDLFCSGILAGALPVVGRLRVLIPSIFVPTALTGCAVLILDWSGPGMAFSTRGRHFGAHLLSDHPVGTAPMNTTILTWNAAGELGGGDPPMGPFGHDSYLDGDRDICAADGRYVVFRCPAFRCPAFRCPAERLTRSVTLISDARCA